MGRGIIFLLVTAGAVAPAQVVQYDITDRDGTDLPAKITFLALDGKIPEGLDVKSRVPEFAARKNVVYEMYGKGEIPVPAGTYRVYVSRGPEHSAEAIEITATADRPAALRAKLERVVDTRGWISGDLHLHTKTFSGHGDANVEERLITLCAEDLEWAVSTDHNHITDYAPYARRLGADRWIKTTVGNEVTTTVLGHFNTFPLLPSLPPVNHRITDARELFRVIRAGPLDEIIQVNHPRWVGINGGYFRDVDLSIGAGDSLDAHFSFDFDSVEIINSNSLGGWEVRIPPTLKVPDVDQSGREDWFNLLNRGFAHAGVGNSDSHEVDSTIAGCPRNYLRSPVDDPRRAEEAELLRSIRRKEVTVSAGIFVTMTAQGGQPLGSMVRPASGEVAFDIEVQAAPWVDADRLVLIGNGEPVWSVDLPGPTLPAASAAAASSLDLGADPGAALKCRPVLRYRGTVRLRPERDSWYVAYAEGNEAPYPMLHQITLPLGFTNPIWVDADGDGKFTSLRDLAAAAVKPARPGGRLRPGEAAARLAKGTGAFKRQAISALLSQSIATDDGGPLAELLGDGDARVREAAALALSRLGGPGAINALLSAKEAAREPSERFILSRELVKLGDHASILAFAGDFARARGLERFRMERDLKELCRKRRIERWWVAGPFPAATVEGGLSTVFPIDGEIDFQKEYPGFEKKTAKWKRASTSSAHFVNFREAFEPHEHAAAYAYVSVEARRPVRTAILISAKCGLEVRLNGRTLHRQLSGKEEADDDESGPEHLLTATFEAGPNRLLVKGVVATGEWGFALRLVDPVGDLRIAVPDPTAPARRGF